MRKQGKKEAEYFTLGHIGQKQWSQDFRGHELRPGPEAIGEYLSPVLFFLHLLPTPINHVAGTFSQPLRRKSLSLSNGIPY